VRREIWQVWHEIWQVRHETWQVRHEICQNSRETSLVRLEAIAGADNPYSLQQVFGRGHGTPRAGK
jgi:hypothetical protein